MAQVSVRVPIAKIEAEVGKPLRVFGFAYLSQDDDGALIVDHGEESVPPEELEPAGYELAKALGPANVDHEGPDVGRLIECAFLSPEKYKAMGLATESKKAGLWVGYEIFDRETAERVRRGELAEFSIEGEAIKEEQS